MKIVSMKELNIEKYICLLIIITPLIDLVNGIFEYVLKVNISPGLLIRSILLMFSIVLFTSYKKKNIFVTLGIFAFFFIQQGVLSSVNFVNIPSEVSFYSKILYNLFLILFLRQYFSDKPINKDRYINVIINSSMIIAGVLIITKVLNIGVSSYGNQVGHKGFFMGLNDVTASLLMALPFVIYRIVTNIKSVKYYIYFAAIVTSLLLLGTKAALAFLLLIILFYIIIFIIKEKQYKKVIIGLLIFILLGYLLSRFYLGEQLKNIYMRQMYFYKKLDLLSYILSKRNVVAGIGFAHWKTSPIYWIFGVGFTQGALHISRFIKGHGMIEMDLLDILYFYGIPMFLFVCMLLVPLFIKGILKVFKEKSLEDKSFYIAYIVAFILSFSGGHIMLSPLAGVYFSLIYAITYNISPPYRERHNLKTNSKAKFFGKKAKE